MPGAGRRPSPALRKIARLALALPSAALVSSAVLGVSPAATPVPAVVARDVEFAGVVAHVEKVLAESYGTQPASEASQRGAGAAAGRHVWPQRRALETDDRSAAVIALLKRAALTGGRRSAAPAFHVPALKPDRAPDRTELRTVVAAAPVGASMQHAPTAGSADDTIKTLLGALQARDKVVADLLRRVGQLERRLILSDAHLDQAVGGAGPVSLLRRSVIEATPSVPAATSPAVVDAPEPPQDAGPSAPVAQAQDSEVPRAEPAAPGQFEVDESLIDRALERTLVQEGVLLLPFGQAEIEPSFLYTRREVAVPAFFTVNGDTFIGEQELKRNEFETGATLRVGLPLDSQIEVGVPYNYVDESVDTTVGGTPQTSNSESGHGFGDVSLGLAKTVLQEGTGWWPDLVARVTWDADTGKTRDNGVFLGGGFNQLSGSLSAVKRQDPLAFVGSVSYAKTFENDNIEPGDELGFSLGTVLAASPETSLSFFFNQSFADDTKLDGDTINGSDQVIGTFGLGAATILGRNVLLSITGEIGLTDDAPDYAIGASVPVRFDLPIF